MQSLLRHQWTGLYLAILGLGAITLFLYGFFPIKYHTGQKAHWDDLPNFIEGVSIDGQEVYNPGENTVILMVIDGLRYDFVTEEYMPFTGQLLKNKSACIYVSVAEPPTVTMPRIKSPERKQEKAQWRRMINFWRDIFAMMTGSVSTFADVALNFGAPAVKGDSVLRVAASRGRRSVLYGDDTWLRLFPGLWTEADGTTSFYVTDYTEVDNNVTRHLDKILTPGENKKPAFDFLVLHYLGLDHIGHLEGARSPKIKPKLIEMDDVVKKIYAAMKLWDHTGVLFICGDHGMRDAGGHGGATPAEVLVPLVVVKSDDFECPHPQGRGPTVAQVDLAPSISWLLDAPLPGDNTGRILPCLLPRDTRQHLYLLHYVAKNNARAAQMQIGEHATEKEFYKQFVRANQQFAQYLSTNQQSAAKIAKEFYEESLTEMSKILTSSTADFDMFAIFLALVLLYAIVISLTCITLHSLQTEPRRLSVSHRARSTAGAIVAIFIIFICIIFIQILACAITETSSSFCTLNPIWISAFIAVSASFTYAFFVTKAAIEYTLDLRYLKDLNSIDYLLIFCTLLHSWTFFGTSFIEEEHMTWYFFWNTLMFLVLLRTVTVVVVYVSKRMVGATEVQDKMELMDKMVDGVMMLPKWIALIALHRYLRTMNQTGDRWQFLPDTADWLHAPGHELYLHAHLIIGTLLTLGICIYNLRFSNNVMQLHSAFTFLSVVCIILYRMATKSLPSFIPGITEWDSVHIVDVFWGLLIAQIVFEILSYLGIKSSKVGNPDYRKLSNKKFVYNQPKEKNEDYVFEESEPWNLSEVKLNMARSISHLMLNDLMLIVILLMRPHNVIMVPSVYITCMVTAKCIEHDLLSAKPGKNSEVLDALSQTLANLWIGSVFFFYQGNSNSLASVDLSAGYVGLRAYSAVRVAARMGLHAHAAPALAGAALYARVAAQAHGWDHYLKQIRRVTNIFALHRVYTLVVYGVVATVFRHHLFVWTVFSPKLMYDFVATVFTVQALLTIAQIVLLTSVASAVARFFAFRKL